VCLETYLDENISWYCLSVIIFSYYFLFVFYVWVDGKPFSKQGLASGPVLVVYSSSITVWVLWLMGYLYINKWNLGKSQLCCEKIICFSLA
jgi:hypothetical protein